jgi:hypothetical protein
MARFVDLRYDIKHKVEDMNEEFEKSLDKYGTVHKAHWA